MRVAKSVGAVLAVSAGIVLPGVGALASAKTVPSCTPSQIAVSKGAAQGTAGTTYYPIIFTNTGGTCRLFGVPVIQPVTGPMHTPVGPAARNMSMGQMPAIHTIAKGQSVSVGFGVTDTGNYPPSCKARNAQGVTVLLGSFVKKTYVKMSISVCTAHSSTTTKLIAPGKNGY